MKFILALLALVAGAFAGPLSSGSLPKCSSACSASPFQKLLFAPDKTYHYKYEGKSIVKLEGVSDAKSELEWEAEVALSWLTPCDMAVQIKSHQFKGQSASRDFERELSEYPLIVAMSDGVATSVCAHPKDTPASLNFKKGIASNIQNTLPSLSKIHSGKTFVETDILGRCPTLYEVEVRSPVAFKVTKRKQHKSCEERFGIQAENPLTSWWLKTPLPLQSSNSTCVQHIEEGIVKETTCKDVNVVKPFLGAYKQIEAVQETRLTLQRPSSGISEVQPMREMRYTNLTSEFTLEPKTEKVLPAVERKLEELCEKIGQQLEEDAAISLAKTIALLSRTPEKEMQQLLSKIKSGQFCHSKIKSGAQQSSVASHKLEQVFLDSIAFINNGGATKIMVEELLSEKPIGGRSALYTMSLHLMQRPCLRTIEAVVPLFESKHAPAPAVLAAGHLVGKYCKEHQNCQQEQPIKEAMEKLARKVEQTCESSERSQEQKIEALTALKAIGNMANMTESLEEQVLRCAESSPASTPVRIAAAQAFRNANCTRKFTKALIQQALKREEQTEVRIASYLAAIRCAEYQEAQEIVETISQEPNTQVRSFILSHLRNQQTTYAPYAKDQQYNLTAFAVPSKYEWDIRRYSKNVDLSYFSDALGLGAGLDTSVVYSPKSYIPRSLQTNITLDLFRNVINIGEFGIRIEDLEVVAERIFGPEGYLQTTPVEQIIKDVSRLVKEKSQKIQNHLEKEMEGERREAQSFSIEQIAKWLQGDSQGRKPTFDLFSRVLGREILFASTKIGSSQESRMDKAIERLVTLASDLFLEYVNNQGVDTARAMQVNNEYFVPTMAGIPLQLKHVTTAIATIKIQSKSVVVKTDIKFAPALSVHTNVFVGHNLGAKNGLRLNATVYSAPEIQAEIDIESSQKLILKVDLPKKNEILKVKSDIYMMKKMPGQADQKTSQRAEQQPKLRKQQCCQKTKSILGLEACYEIEVPKMSSDQLPLGKTQINLSLEKVQKQKEALKTVAQWKLSEEEKEVTIALEAPGAAKPVKAEVEISYRPSAERQSAVIFVKVPEAGFKKAIKVEVASKSTHVAKQVELHVYSSQQKQFERSDKVIELHAAGAYDSEEVSGQLVCKTMSPLSKYVKLDIDIDYSAQLASSMYYAPRSVNLRRFEVEIELLQKLRTKNFIRKSSKSAHAEYQVKSMTEYKQTPLLDIEGDAKIQGHVESRDLQSSAKLQVRLPSSSFETQAEFILTEQRNKTLLTIKRSSGQRLFHAEAEMKKESSGTRSIKAEVEAPKYTHKYALVGEAAKSSADQYSIRLIAKKNDQAQYKIEGPMKLKFTPEERHYYQQSQLKIESVKSSESMTLKTKVSLTPQQKEIQLSLKNRQQQEVAAIEVQYQKQGEQEHQTYLRVNVPKAIESTLKVTKSPSRLDVESNMIVMPSTQQARRVKTNANIDFDQEQIKAVIALNADKNPRETISVDAHYKIDTADKSASIQGSATVNQKTYSYNVQTVLQALKSKRQQQQQQQQSNLNQLKIKLTSPQQETFEFEIKSDIQSENRQRSTIQFESRLKTYKREIYHLSSESKVQYSSRPFLAAIEGSTKLRAPKIKEITFVYDNKISAQEKEVKIMMELSGAKIQKQAKVQVQVSRQSSSEGKSMVVVDGGSLLEVRIQSDARLVLKQDSMRVEECDCSLEVKLPNTPEYEMKLKSSQSSPAELRLKKGSQELLTLEYETEAKGEWKIRISSPSRRMEAGSQSGEAHVRVYPDTSRADQRYEAQVSHQRRHSMSSNSEQVNSLISITYPGRNNPLKLESWTESSEDKSQGTIELDIFKNQNDKINVQVEVYRMKPATYEVKAQLNAPRLNLRPQLVSVISYTPEVKQFDLQLRKQEKSSPALDISLSYVKTSPQNANVYALLKTQTEKYEATAAIQPHNMFACRGQAINGTLHAASIGSIDFVSAICKPAYIEFGVKRSSEQKMFITKIGMMNPANIKFAIDQVFNSSSPINAQNAPEFETTLSLYGRPQSVPKKPVFLIGTKMMTSMFISSGLKYNTTSMSEYRTAVKHAMKQVQEIAEQLYERIPEEVSQAVLGNANLELAEELEQLKREGRQHINKLRQEIEEVLPSRETIQQAQNKAREMYKKAQEKVNRAAERLNQIVESTTGMSLKEIENKIKNAERKVQEKAQQLKREALQVLKRIEQEGVEALREFEATRPAYEQMQKLKQTVQESSIWRWIVERFENEIHGIKHMFKSFWNAVHHDLKSILQEIENITPIKAVIEWVKHLFGGGDDDVSSSRQERERSALVPIVAKLMGVYIGSESGSVSVQIPLRTPVSSLQAAIPNIGLPYIRIPTSLRSQRIAFESLVSPYSRPAQFDAENEEVKTFDGLTIPFVKSPCKIVLVKDQQGNKAVVSKNSQEQTELEVTAQNGEKMRFVLQQGGQIRTPSLSGKSYRSKEMNVTKESQKSVQIKLTSFTIYLEDNKIVVQPKPWAFAQLSGLMGSNDSEMGNDYSSSSKDIMEQYREQEWSHDSDEPMFADQSQRQQQERREQSREQQERREQSGEQRERREQSSQRQERREQSREQQERREQSREQQERREQSREQQERREQSDQQQERREQSREQQERREQSRQQQNNRWQSREQQEEEERQEQLSETLYSKDQGTHELSRSHAQRLLEQYRENQSCQLPKWQ